MANIGLDGILSGIDYDKMTKGLVAVEYLKYKRMKATKSNIEAKSKAMGNIQSAFNALKNLTNEMKDINKVQSFKATSNDTKVVSVVAKEGGVDGITKIQVEQLAQSSKVIFDAGYSLATSKVGAGGSKSFAISDKSVANSSSEAFFTTGSEGAVYKFDFGTEDDIDEVSFEANKSYTLKEVVDIINAKSQEAAGYDAASIEGTGPYKLKLSARNRGARGELIVEKKSGDEIPEFNYFTSTEGTAPAEGKFTYSYNGVSRTIHTSSDTSLTDLANSINKDSENPGVHASILKYNDQYHLVLTGKKTGAKYKVQIDDANTTLDKFKSANLTETQIAQDAKYRVDGFPKDPDWMTSEANTIADVVPGVTFSMHAKGEVTVSQSKSTDFIKAQLRSLVATYNRTSETIELYTGYDDKAKKGGLLQGDSTIQSMLEPIRSLMVNVTKGFESNSKINKLSDFGIEIDKNGTLKLDESQLDKALEENYDDVVNYISANKKGRTSSTNLQFKSALDSTKASSYDVKSVFDNTGKLISAKIKLKSETDSQWRDLDISGNEVTGKAGNPEAGLELKIIWDGSSSTMTNSVSLQDGLGASLNKIVEGFLSSSGPLKSTVEGYEKQTNELKERMDKELVRLDGIEDRMKAKWARLEATLAKYKGMKAQVSALVNSMSTSSSDDKK